MVERFEFPVLPVEFPSYNPHLPEGVLPQDVNVQMERILASDLFQHSERLKKLLRYLVTHMLWGKTDEIKEYRIATEVFGRKESFEPEIDPIVRVQAHRLRTKLQAYMQRHAISERLIIDLPKGAYIVRVQKTPRKIDNHIRSTYPRLGRFSIGVLPLLDLRLNKIKTDVVTDSLTEELIHSLMGEPDFLVASWTAVVRFKTQDATIQSIAKQLQVNMLLEGSIRQINECAHIRIRVIDTESGFSRRLGTYEREMTDFLADHRELAGTIISDLKALLAHQRQELLAG
jgi:TolB-like protein